MFFKRLNQKLVDIYAFELNKNMRQFGVAHEI